MILTNKNPIQEVIKKIKLINMIEFLKIFIKWFKCKLNCCFKSSCSIGEDNTETKIHYDYYSGRRKSI